VPRRSTSPAASCRAGRPARAPPPLARESEGLLALTAYVAHQSRGQPISPPDDPRLLAARERGRALYAERRGQLDLSCAQCHDDNAGRRLAGSTIPLEHDRRRWNRRRRESCSQNSELELLQ
jgi:sulfur-oxidizing protein SoxA